MKAEVLALIHLLYYNLSLAAAAANTEEMKKKAEITDKDIIKKLRESKTGYQRSITEKDVVAIVRYFLHSQVLPQTPEK